MVKRVKSKEKIVNLDIIEKYLPKENLTFIDVGAFNGNYSIDITTLFPTAIIHAIEACPINFKELVKRTKLYPNILSYHLAISDHNGKIKLWTTIEPNAVEKFGNVSSQCNSLYKDFLAERKKKIKKVIVQSTTIDDFCNDNKIQHIDCLKINCEGCEFNIFDGNTDFLDKTSMIVIAIHGKAKVFKKGKYVDKRKHIVKTIKDYDFTMIKGDGNLPAKRHILQVWIKDKLEKEHE